MGNFSEAFDNSFSKDYMDLLSNLSMPRDFISRLSKDDDWSFVVKLHSLMEIAFSHLLTNHFGSDFKQVFDSLDMGNKSHGKVVFARKLRLIEDKNLLFAELLGELRNIFVHDIRSMDDGLNGYFSFIEKDRKDRYNKWIELSDSQSTANEVTKEAGDRFTADQILRIIARKTMVYYSVNTMRSIYLHSEISKGYVSLSTHLRNTLYQLKHEIKPTLS